MVDIGSAVGYLLLDTSGFQKGFKSAFADMQSFMDKTNTVADRTAALGKSFTTIGTSLTKYVTLPLVGIATASMKVGNDFEAQMSRVQAIAGATGSELEELTDQALQLGADTAFSASEAASGMENLASAGFATNEIIEAMPGLLNLAASSGADLAVASEIAASAVRGFGLEASDTTHVADVFAEAAARTNAQTEDMGEAMKYIAPVANAMGQSLEMTSAAIGIMSDAGIKGGQAGTALRGALSRLASPTDEMTDKMNELGLSFYDAEGNMLPLTGIVEQLETKMGGLTQEQRNNALVTLFGQESLSGMLALMERGSGDLAALTQDFESADGAAANMAETMMNNTSGAIEQMLGSIETLGIKIQQVLAPVVTSVVNKITGIVNALSSLDEGTLSMVVTIAGIVAAAGPVLLILGKTLILISNVMTAVSSLSAVFGTISTVLAGFVAPALAIVAVLATLYVAWQTDFNGMRDTVSNVFASVQSIISDAITIVQSIVTIALGLLTTAWQSNFANIQGIVTAVFNIIQTTIQNVLAVIQSIFDIWAAVFTGDWQGVWQGVQDLFVNFWTAILTLLANFLNLIIQAILGIVGGVYDAIMAVCTSIQNGFTAGWQKVTAWWDEASQDPVSALMNIGQAMFDAGASVFNRLFDGMKSVWDGIMSWVENSISWLVDQVTFWDNATSKMSTGGSSGKAKSSGVEGSYASGLDYVPRDMNVRVHEGEEIVTKQERKEREENNGGGDTYNFYSPKPLDEVTAAREFRKVKKEIAEDMLK